METSNSLDFDDLLLLPYQLFRKDPTILQKWQNAFTRRYVTADEVLEAHSDVAKELVEELPAQLEEINKALKGTPFEVSYRVLNELTIMVGVMLDEDRELDGAITQSVNNILLMKISSHGYIQI